MPSITKVRETLKQNKESLLDRENVNGVGIGRRRVDGEYTDEFCVVVFVKSKKKEEELSRHQIVPKTLDGVRTDVVEVGEIKRLSSEHRRKVRPLVGGISIGHKKITAGTLGAVARDADTGEHVILSNNHVIANNNDAHQGDDILQPGPADNGRDVVAELDRFIPIKFNRPRRRFCSFSSLLANTFNFVAKTFNLKTRLAITALASANLVDAAVAIPLIDTRRLMKGMRKGPQGIREAFPGDKVIKSGRTTGVTNGYVDYVDVEVEVDFGPDGLARFEDQIMLTRMSEPGDSGSVILRKDDDKMVAVGLLFAGSDQVTIANRMSNVEDLLGVTF